MKELSVKSSLILSYNEKRDVVTKTGTISVIPVMEWLLGIGSTWEYAKLKGTGRRALGTGEQGMRYEE